MGNTACFRKSDCEGEEGHSWEGYGAEDDVIVVVVVIIITIVVTRQRPACFTGWTGRARGHRLRAQLREPSPSHTGAKELPMGVGAPSVGGDCCRGLFHPGCRR